MFLLRSCLIPYFDNKDILHAAQIYAFLSAITTGPLNSWCEHCTAFWVTTEKTHLVFMWVNNHFCLKDATYEASLLNNGTAAQTAIYKRHFKLLQPCFVRKLSCETEESASFYVRNKYLCSKTVCTPKPLPFVDLTFPKIEKFAQTLPIFSQMKKSV
jgi:hypothetical protein